ncbi:MAG: type I restriction enzyme HsdR N-terminal domain-containing protein [Rikenellaceae bacterium]|nr:type I restriction enzyme HsdR N-terminal domain-containing protein [Rikenellaceae bacterium]
MPQDKKEIYKIPQPDLITRINNGKREIWDDIRRRGLVCTPEEWVRQNFIRYLIDYKNANALFIKQEHLIKLNNTSLRADIVVYDSTAKPFLLIECKAPHIKLTEKIINQVCKYNMIIKAPYVGVTNGITHFCFRYSPEKRIMEKIDFFPIIK